MLSLGLETEAIKVAEWELGLELWTRGSSGTKHKPKTHSHMFVDLYENFKQSVARTRLSYIQLLALVHAMQYSIVM